MEVKLPKVITKTTKRVGRGYGSGKGGHTSGRGTKGQKARGSVGILFEGLKIKKSLLHRLPNLRGKSKFKAGVSPVVVNIDDLERLPGGTVDLAALIKYKLVDARKANKYGVKILGRGATKKKFDTALNTSESAKEKLGKVKETTKK